MKEGGGWCVPNGGWCSQQHKIHPTDQRNERNTNPIHALGTDIALKMAFVIYKFKKKKW